MKTRQERREERQAKKKAKMVQHGKGIAKVYKNVVTRRVNGKEI